MAEDGRREGECIFLDNAAQASRADSALAIPGAMFTLPKHLKNTGGLSWGTVTWTCTALMGQDRSHTTTAELCTLLERFMGG